jgi:hypothetical protein
MRRGVPCTAGPLCRVVAVELANHLCVTATPTPDENNCMRSKTLYVRDAHKEITRANQVAVVAVADSWDTQPPIFGLRPGRHANDGCFKGMTTIANPD